MPLSSIAEAVLQPVFEAVLHVAGYLTGYVVVPTFTFGFVRVDSEFEERKRPPAMQRVKRGPNGSFLIDSDLGTLCGLIFWVLVGVGVFMWHR